MIWIYLKTSRYIWDTLNLITMEMKNWKLKFPLLFNSKVKKARKGTWMSLIYLLVLLPRYAVSQDKIFYPLEVQELNKLLSFYV